VRGVGWRKCVLGCALVLAQIRLNFDAHDFSRQNLFSAFGRALLDGVPESAGSSKVAAGRAAFPDLPTKQSGGKARGAILLANGDEVVNALRYVQRCEGYRADVLIVDLNYIQFAWFVSHHAPAHLPGVVFPGSHYGNGPNSFQLDAFLAANSAKYDVYSAGGFLAADRSWELRHRTWPTGLLHRLVPRDARIDLNAEWQTSSAQALRLSQLRSEVQAASPLVVGSWEEVVANNHLAQAVHNRAFAILQIALELGGNRDVFLLAARLYEELALNEGAAAGPTGAPVPDYVYRNIGVSYSRLITLAADEASKATATQRASGAFLRYLSFSGISAEDRKQVEGGLLGLIMPAQAAGRTGSKPDSAALPTGAKRKAKGAGV